MAKLFRKRFYILEFSWGYEARERYPKTVKNQNRVTDCITLEISGFRTRKGGVKFQVKSNDNWSTIIRNSYPYMDRSAFKSVADIAIDQWISEKEPEYHYRDEY